jgi:hypothetical protein
MLMGVGIIGALASILASYLVPSPQEEDKAEASDAGELRSELAGIKEELAAVRRALDQGKPSPGRSCSS